MLIVASSQLLSEEAGSVLTAVRAVTMKSQAKQIENLQFMIMAKGGSSAGSEEESPSEDNVLL